jgi:hypothetical protein
MKRRGRVHLGIEGVPREAFPFLHVIRCIVLAARREPDSAFLSFLSLETLDILEGVRGSDSGVLPGRLLAAAPPWVSEDVDVRRPIREAGLAGVVHAEGLRGDGLGDRAPQRAVEGGGGQDDLREVGGGADGARGEVDPGPVVGEAVERLGPPLVGRDAQARDAARRVGQLRDLLVQGEQRDERARAGRDGERRVAERVGAGRVGRRARARVRRGGACCAGAGAAGEEAEEGDEHGGCVAVRWGGTGFRSNNLAVRSSRVARRRPLKQSYYLQCCDCYGTARRLGRRTETGAGWLRRGVEGLLPAAQCMTRISCLLAQ